MKRILAVLLALVVLCAAVAVSVVAAESAGTVADLNDRIGKVEAAETPDKKYSPMLLALSYYNTRDFSACDQEELAAAVAKLKTLTVDVAGGLVTYQPDADVKAEDRLANYKKAQNLLKNIDLNGVDGYDALVTKMGTELSNILEKGMAYITYTPSEDPEVKEPTAAERKKNYDSLAAIVSDKDVDLTKAANYEQVAAAMNNELITIANMYLTEDHNNDPAVRNANIQLAKAIVETYDLSKVEGYDALLVAIDTNSLQTAKMYVEAETADVFATLANFGSAANILAEKDYSAVDGYDDVQAAMVTGSKSMFEQFMQSISYVQGDNGYYNTAVNSTYLNRASYISKSLISGWTEEEITAAQKRVEEARATHDQMKMANRVLTEGGTDLQDYYLNNIIENQTFEYFNSKLLYIKPVDNYIGPYAFNGGSVLLVDGRVEKCQTFFQTFSALSGYSPKGLVLEFDIGTLGTMSEWVSVEGGGHKLLDGSSTDNVYPTFFSITANGDLRLRKNDEKSVIRSNLIVPGELVHFGMVYDQSDYTYRVYCEEELVGEESATWNTGGKKFESLNVIRFDSQTGIGMNYIFDNLKIYQGIGLRDVDKIKKMSEDEQFVFYARYLNDESRSISTRKFAYGKCTASYAKYYSEADGNYTSYLEGLSNADMKKSLEAAVSEYQAFDYDKVMSVFSEQNLATFLEYVKEFEAIERAPGTVADREALKIKISEFLTNNNGFVKQDDSFKAASATLAALEKELAFDQNADAFILQATRFGIVSTISAKQKYYNAMLTYHNDSNAPVDDNLYNTYKNDSKLAEAFANFINAYEVFLDAQGEIEALVKDQTSKTIIDCVGFLTPIDENKWFEDETYEYMNMYVLLVRDAITPNEDDSLKYNPDYAGVADAIATFEPINDAFYIHLQQIHLAEINRVLDLINGTDAYIEKLGLTSYITRYIEENEIDESIAEIQNALICYNTVLEELQYRTDDYQTVLKQNAATFNSLVRQMSYSTNYASKKVLFDQATVYYFMLDASTDETKEMISVYDEAKLYFAAVEAASKSFIETVAELLAATDADERYELLTVCYDYSLTADASYEGVATTLAAFNEIYNAYITAIEPDNAALVSIANVLGSLRANGETSALADVLVRILAGK